MNEMSLETRIYKVYKTLSPAQKRMADVLLQYQMELPSHTAGELAERAAVSNSTAARLIQTLGYLNYPEARRQIREDQHWGSPQVSSENPDERGSEPVSVKGMLQADLENIKTTLESIPDGKLDEISRAIADAKRVWILGLRSGYGLAVHAAHYFTLIRQDVYVLPAGGGTYSHEIASVGEQDLMLTIAFRRRPRLLPTLLQEVHLAGARTVLITDLSAASSARAADDVLRCRCYSPAPFNSFAAAVSIINYLAWKTASLLERKSVGRYQKVNRLVGLLDGVSTPAAR